MATTTRDRLLEAGLSLLLTHRYHDLGIQALLKQTNTPKGSFYHHFTSKEDFALQVIDRYMEEVQRGLDVALGDPSLTPLGRARRFFELTREKYRQDGYLGCMLGGLGQELSGVNATFAARIEACFGEISGRIASCLEEARHRGEIPQDADPRELANLLLNCWEGAALRSRLLRDPGPLDRMLDFTFSAATRAS